MISRDTTKISRIDEWVNTGKENSLTLENTNIINFKDNIGLPVYNILRNKYRSTITMNSIRYQIGEEYFYRPKKLSMKLYGTIELWHMLLWLNNMVTSSEFSKKLIRALDPNAIPLINEMIERESEYLQDNRNNPVTAISNSRVYRRD